ncbi:beta-ketoacyl synthase chain length factor [Pseudohalioglobus sediminis]|nr:beta-ketoacyl synthase chain length factor [Pseudohalioglobus sediminis]
MLEKPSLKSIPPIQRRRLGKLARVVFHVLEEAMGDISDQVVIFSSRMGEIQRTQSILEAIASQHAVSPADFSLSVHNAIAGQWSLIHKVRQPLLALAPGNGGPVPALLEAYAHLISGETDRIAVVCFEENYPEFYQPYIHGPQAPTALALQLVLDCRETTLELKPLETYSGRETTGFTPLAELLMKKSSQVQFSDRSSSWDLRITA